MTQQGVVMKSTGVHYVVRCDTGEKVECILRGRMRLTGSKETNPVAVGDRVLVANNASDIHIVDVLKRKNHILRASSKKTGHSHVMAANIDLLVVMASFIQPRTSTGFIDRLLATAEAFDIPQCILCNKTDVLTAADRTELDEIVTVYKSLKIPTLLISALYDSMHSVLGILEGKTSLFAGHSGVGKTTLFNRLIPGSKRAVGDISSFSGKGKHTTTFVEMFELNARTFIIDTPGIKEWGMIAMIPPEISDYFVELRDIRLDCKYGARCLHVNEPQCAVIDAVHKGVVSPFRYKNYLSILRGEDNRK